MHVYSWSSLWKTIAPCLHITSSTDSNQTLVPRDLVSHGRCAAELVFQVEQAGARVAAVFPVGGWEASPKLNIPVLLSLNTVRLMFRLFLVSSVCSPFVLMEVKESIGSWILGLHIQAEKR